MEAVSDARGSRGDPAAKPAGPGATGNLQSMWLFVIGDLFIFGAYFVIYLIKRILHHDMFVASQAALDRTLGAFNTLLLLASSLFIALCVQAARIRQFSLARNYAGAAVVMGIVFAGAKFYEWSMQIRAGHTLGSNEFFTFYYFLTGIHVFHLLCGLIVLGVIIRELGDVTLRAQEVVEAGATYWHMIDLLWVVIFALLYLIR